MKYRETTKLTNSILQQYQMPLTLRQIFYRLVADCNYPNTSSAYCHLSKQLVQARKEGIVDKNMIEDRSRDFLGGDYGFFNIEEYLNSRFNEFLSSPKVYSRNMWSDQPEFVVVFVEKDALSRVLSNVADHYNVMTAVSRGYASYTYIIQIIERFPVDKETTVLHFADHDPSGLDMTRDLQNRLSNYSIDPLRTIQVERVALSFDQVQRFGLSPNPTKSADPRIDDYVSQFGDQCWELDAIEPNELQRIAEEAIVRHIDSVAWKSTLAEQELERKQLDAQFSVIEKKLQEIGLP
jgi:hypothetical protein